jgi:hypothetical protein
MRFVVCVGLLLYGLSAPAAELENPIQSLIAEMTAIRKYGKPQPSLQRALNLLREHPERAEEFLPITTRWWRVSLPPDDRIRHRRLWFLIDRPDYLRSAAMLDKLDPDGRRGDLHKLSNLVGGLLSEPSVPPALLDKVYGHEEDLLAIHRTAITEAADAPRGIEFAQAVRLAALMGPAARPLSAIVRDLCPKHVEEDVAEAWRRVDPAVSTALRARLQAEEKAKKDQRTREGLWTAGRVLSLLLLLPAGLLTWWLVLSPRRQRLVRAAGDAAIDGNLRSPDRSGAVRTLVPDRIPAPNDDQVHASFGPDRLEGRFFTATFGGWKKKRNGWQLNLSWREAYASRTPFPAVLTIGARLWIGNGRFAPGWAAAHPMLDGTQTFIELPLEKQPDAFVLKLWQCRDTPKGFRRPLLDDLEAWSQKHGLRRARRLFGSSEALVAGPSGISARFWKRLTGDDLKAATDLIGILEEAANNH